jgi:membrane glycosyltransferase
MDKRMTTEGNVVRAFPRVRPQPAGVPTETSGAMPPQDYWRWQRQDTRKWSHSKAHSHVWRRAVVLCGALALIVWAIRQMFLVLSVGDMTRLEYVVLVLFSINFAWIALSFSSATAGIIDLLSRRFRRIKPEESRSLKTRTAIIVPTYNEAPGGIFARAEALTREIYRFGEANAFDLFILSDTTNPDIALAEEAAFIELRARLGENAPVYYRRRRKNHLRKIGNIADFCCRWGGAYDFMLVLDADSLMSGGTAVTLARRMEADPHLGLLQTLPMIVNAETLFARIHQFANRAYGIVLGNGLAWWTQNEGNYWGHNAIIRTGAFMESAGLSELKGTPPFGGPVLSHDFIEAALLRRAGWKVRMATDINGSYEESPPSLLDLAVRDRRWCQGNLQHTRLLPAKGFHWISRLHLLSGIMSYLASPFWMLLILSGLILTLEATLARPEYFPAYFTFFPHWPIIDPRRALTLFFATTGVLLAPKLYGYLWIVFDKKWRGEAGGVVHGAISVLMEIVLSALVAPIMMCIQTGAVVGVIAGRDSGWKPQRREGGKIAFAAIFQRHLGHTVFGVVLTMGALVISPALAAWLSPALVGLILSVPISAVTASEAAGHVARRLSLFLTPEEVTPPPIAAEAEALRPIYADAIASAASVHDLARDPHRCAHHTALIRPEQRSEKGQFDESEILAAAKIAEADTRDEALAFLTPPERQALVNSTKLITALAAKPA